MERTKVTLYADGPAHISSFLSCPDRMQFSKEGSVRWQKEHKLVLSAKDNRIHVEGLPGASASTTFDQWLWLTPVSASSLFFLQDQKTNLWRSYKGTLLIGAVHEKLRVILESSLDDYVNSVLAGEMPEAYELEAIKAQAVAARSYALKPRIDHTKDQANVCDSYLCCQCFVGVPKKQSAKYLEAIHATSDQVLTYASAPILALFSACAGGHTENYEDCFSNLETNAFPDKPLPCLKGVTEGKTATQAYALNPASTLPYLWHKSNPDTFDAWSKHFRWHLNLSAQSLESHMHYIASKMLNDPEQAPYIVPSEKSVFGHIQSFEIIRRGSALTAMTMNVNTSKGLWQFNKELIIRNIFENPDLKLHRLPSARIFFEHTYDWQGLLSTLQIFGLGSGHGVGLQQDGAQGMARRGFTYKEILRHYYTGSQIERV